MASINFENIKEFAGVEGGPNVLSNPTSLAFGPDGRLYVSEQNGTINAFTVEFSAGEVLITGHEALTLANGQEVVKSIQNHNDDGSDSSETNRQVTGILTAGTADAPIVYVSSSDPRIASNGEVNLDTNSGVLTKVAFDPDIGTWTAVDLVRGLPRSEENHSVNGMVLSPDGTKLYLQVGGFTNNGAPSQFFSYTAEYALSGAILEIDLVALDAIETKTDPDGGQGSTARQYKYDLPTLDDPNIDNVTDGVGEDADGMDEAGPWGGNDGLNQAILPADAPLRIYADGLRNGYDLAITDDGQLYTVDNGSNGNLGGDPNTDGNGEAINTPNDGGSGDPEPLFLIEDGGYYGHPNPTRANQDQAWTVYDDDGNPDSAVTVNQVPDISALVPDVVNIQDGFLIDPSKFTGDPARLLESGIREERSTSASIKIASVGSSTNGIVVYDSDGAAFNGALDGKLFVTQFNDNVTLLNVNADGTALNPVLESGPDGIFGTADDEVQEGGADGILEVANNSLGVPLANPLDVTVGPDGTLWVAEIGGNEITVLAPTVTINPDDPDSDNDGIDNIFDPFVRDATNGTSVVVTPGVDLLFDFDPNQDGNLPGPAGFGGGLTGVMIDGVTNPEAFLQAPSSLPGQEINLDNVKFTTAAGGGTTVIEAVSNGDPFQGNNSGEFLFHTGVTLSPSVETFTVTWSFFNPGTDFTGNFQQIGGYIGTGDQSNYLKVVAIQNNNGEIQVSLEDGDDVVASDLLQADDLFDVDPTDNAKIFIELSVNPDAETATPTIVYEDAFGATKTVNGNPVSLTGTAVLDAIRGDAQVNGQQTGLAVGLFSSNTGQDPANTFQAVFDDIQITATEKQVAPEPGADALTTQINTTLIIPVSDLLANDTDANDDALSLTAVGNAQNANVSLDDNGTPGDPVDDLVIFTPADGFEGTATFDYTLSDGTLESTGNVTVDVSDQVVLFRLNTAQETIQALPNDPFGSTLDWIGTGGAGAQSGTQSGLDFSVNTGNISTHNITGRDASVPDYVPQDLFAKERWDPDSGAEMVYSFGNGALPIGTYTVNLFAGNGFSGTSAPGERVFDVEIEGAEVFTDVDLSAQFGHQTGGLLTWTGQVSDGTLDIEWLHDVENPTVNGIEIIAGATGDLPLTVSILGGDQTVGEADGQAFVSVLTSRTVPNDENVSFTYVIEGVTATPETDYSPDASLNGSGTATFTGNATIGGGSSDFQIPIDILPDDLVEGSESFTVTITSVSANAAIGANASTTVTIADDDVPAVDPGEVVYRVNAGGPTVADPDGGPDWSGDQGETANNDAETGPSSPYLVDRGVANDNVTYGNIPPEGPGINGTGAPDDLFVTERFSTLQNPNNIGYAFPVPDGDYVVNLYFDELFFAAPGSRVFDVELEGDLVLDDFDTFAAYGNDTGLQSFEATVTDGVLNLEFLKTAVNNPHVAAIEILAAGDSDPLPKVAIAAPSPSTLAEGDGGTTALVFPVTFDAPPSGPVTVDYTVETNGAAPIAGSVELSADGSVTVDVADDDLANGDETVTVTLTGISAGDAVIDTGMASASATVSDDDAAPVAGPDTVATPVGTGLAFAAADLLINDSDADTEASLLSVTAVGDAGATQEGGTVTLASGTVTYTPPAGFSGTDTFSYTVSDDAGNTSNGTVTVAVGDGAPVLVRGDLVSAINAGGPELTQDGIVFAANTAAGGEAPFSSSTTFGDSNGGNGQQPELNGTVFKTERNDGGDGAMAFALPVAAGQYFIDLYFAELFQSAEGDRVFDLFVEGELVLDDYDIFASLNGDLTTGLVVSLPDAIDPGANNQIDISWDATGDDAVDRGTVNAIAIYEAVEATDPLPLVSVAAPVPDTVEEAGGQGSSTTLLFPVSFDTPPAAPVTISYSVDLAGEVVTGLETTLGADGFISVDVPADDVANGAEIVTVTLTGISAGDATIDAASASATVTEDDTSPGDSFNGIQATGNDWSDDATAPDAIVLEAGSNTLILQAALGDADYVTFEVPAGQQLVTATLTAYAGGANAAFLGLQQGTSVPSQADIQDGLATLDGGTVFDATQVASDLLPLLTSTSVENAGQPTGDLPDVLGPGQYTFWYNQNQSLSDATLELVTEPVPTGDPFPGADIPVGDAVLAINSGTGGALASDPVFGLPFKADEQFATPSNTYTDGAAGSDASGDNPAFDGSILETERFAETLTYTLTQLGDGTPLVAGDSYVLDLIATELFQDTAGARLFDISVNGTLIVDDLDLVASFGIDDPATADLEGVYRLRTPVTVNPDGEILVELSASEDNAKLNGLILFETEAASLPSVAIAADADVVAEAEGAQAAFTVSLSEPVPAGQTVIVDYLVGAAGDTAAAGTDYVAQSGQLVFGEGMQSQPLLVDLINDQALEPAETLTVTLTGADLDGTALDLATAAATVELAAETAQTGEPGSETLTVQDSDELVDLSSGGSDTVSGTPGQFNDLTISGFDTDDTVSIAGASSANITGVTEGSVMVGLDTDSDGVEDTVVTFDSLPDPTPQTPLGPDDFQASYDAGTGTANLGFAPQTQSVSLIGPDITVLDEASEDAVVLTVKLSQPAAGPVTVDYTLSGTADEGSDYRIAPGGSVVIPEGATEGLLVLETLNDSLAEVDESLTVSLVSTTEGALAPDESALTFTLVSEDTGDGPGAPVTLEAEDFTGLASSTFFEQAALDASGLALIRLDGGQSGTVETSLPDAVTPGLYDVAVTYFDENDGTSSAALAVDGETIGNWLFSNDGPGSAAQAANLRTLVFQGVALGADSVLSLSGTQDFGEFVRFDKVDLTRTGDLPPDDTTGPTATLSFTPPASPGDPAILHVTLSDESDIDAATIAAADAGITGPDGPVAPISPPDFDSTTKTVTYTFAAPDGGWTPGDYTVTFADGAVADTAGNPSQTVAPVNFTVVAPVETADAALDGDLDGDTLANSADGDIDGDGTPNLQDRAAYNAGEVALDLVAEGSFAIDFTSLTPGLTPFEAGFDGVAQTADGSAELDYATNNGAEIVEAGGEGRLQFASTNADTNNGQQAFTRLIDTGGAGFTFTGTFDNPAFGAGTNLVNFSQYGLLLSMTGAPGANTGVDGEFFKAVAGSPGNDFETSGKGAFSGADLKVALPAGVTQDDYASVELAIVGTVDGATVTLTSSYTAFDENGTEIASGLIGAKTVTPGTALHAALTGTSDVPVAFGVTSSDFGNGGSFPVSLQALSLTSASSPLDDTDGPTASLDVQPPAEAGDPILVTVTFADDKSGLDPATLDGDELVLTSDGPDTIPAPIFQDTGNGTATYTFAAPAGGWQGTAFSVALAGASVSDLAGNANAPGTPVTFELGDAPSDPALDILNGLAGVDADGAYGPEATGSVLLSILAGGTNVEASNFGNTSFALTNTGQKQVAAVFIDVGKAIYGDSVFDNDGSGGDTISQLFSFNGGSDAAGQAGFSYELPGDTPLFPNTPNNSVVASGGFDGLAVLFNGSQGGFATGETVLFGGDMDPNSIAALNKSDVDAGALLDTQGDWDVGGISGAELIGSEFTVLFDDGTTARGVLFSDGSKAGSIGEAVQDGPQSPVSVRVNGFEAGDAGAVYGGAEPVITVTGTPGQEVRVVVTHGFNPVSNTADNIAGIVADRLADREPDFQVNNAANVQIVDLILGSDGTATVPAGAVDYTTPPSGVLAEEGGLSYDTLPIAVAAAAVTDATDGSGKVAVGPASAPVYLTSTGPVTGGNNAPQITGDAALSVESGAAVVLTTADLSASDDQDDDAALVFEVSGLSNGSVQVEGAAVSSFTQAQLAAGAVSFVHDGSATTSAGFDVTVTDSDGAGSGPFQIDVAVTPSAASLVTLNLIDPVTDEVIRALAPTDLIEFGDFAGGQWTVQAVFNGTGQQSVQFLIDGAVAQTESFAPYALFGDLFGPSPDYNGGDLPANGETLSLTANVYSGTGATGTLLASRTVDLTFAETGSTNLPPVVDNPVADDTVVVDAPLSIDVSEVFSDADGDTLLLEASGLPDGVDLIDGLIVGTPTQAGVFPVTLSADDGQASVEDSFVLTVVPEGNLPPEVGTEIPDETVTAGVVFTLTLPDDAFTDAEDPDLDLSLLDPPEGFTLEGTTLTGSADIAPDTYDLTVVATDDDANTASQTFTVTVVPSTASLITLNLIDPATDEVVRALQATDLIGLAELTDGQWAVDALFDGSGEGSIEFLIDGELVQTENFAPYALFGGNGSDFNGQAVPAGETVTLTANVYSGSGGSGSLLASRTVSLSFVEGDDVNLPPVVTNPVADDTVQVDEDLSIDVSDVFSDANGDALLIEASGLPAGLELLDGAITGTPTETGTFTVTLTADDGEATAQDSFQLSVVPEPPSPVILNLIDPITDTVVQTLADGDVVALESLSADLYAIEVQFDGSGDQSVVLSVNGSLAATESFEPYALFGDELGDFNGAETPAPGTAIELTAEVYSADGGQGNLLASRTVSFTFEETATAAAATPLALAATGPSSLSDPDETEETSTVDEEEETGTGLSPQPFSLQRVDDSFDFGATGKAATDAGMTQEPVTIEEDAFVFAGTTAPAWDPLEDTVRADGPGGTSPGEPMPPLDTPGDPALADPLDPALLDSDWYGVGG